MQGDAAPLKSFGENSFYGKTSENPYTILHAYMSSAPRPDVQNGAMVSLGFMHYDLGYIDLEEKTLQPLNNPFGP